MTRATAARAHRGEVADVLAGRLDRIAIGHLDQLTPAEAALLAETIRAMKADIEHLARDRRGLAQARSADIAKRIAAEDTIREVEQDRDTLAEQHLRLGTELKHWQTSIVPGLVAERDQARAAAARALAVKKAPGRSPWNRHANAKDDGWDEALDAVRDAVVTPAPGARPVHPDGTPYGYADIVAEGWEHCDGCQQWGRGWTSAFPHECPTPRPAATTKEP